MININKTFNDKFYKQNPALMLEHSIPVKITRYFTDVNGTIVDKTLVPASLQVKYPIYLLGQFDRNGGYKKSITATPPMPGTFYYMSFTQGVNSPFLSFTGLNTIKGFIRTGDIVEVFTDDLENPTYFVWFVISSEPVSISSIISNTESTQADNRIGVLYVQNYQYVSDNAAQYFEPIIYSRFDNIGNYRTDSVQPYIYKTPYVEQTGILTIDNDFKLDQYIGLNMYFLFATNSITLTFKVVKI
jgi:hypothetical protein